MMLLKEIGQITSKSDKFGTFSQRGQGFPFFQFFSESDQKICICFVNIQNDPCLLKDKINIHYVFYVS